MDQIIQLAETLNAEASLGRTNSLRLFVNTADTGEALYALFYCMFHCALYQNELFRSVYECKGTTEVCSFIAQ